MDDLHGNNAAMATAAAAFGFDFISAQKQKNKTAPYRAAHAVKISPFLNSVLIDALEAQQYVL